MKKKAPRKLRRPGRIALGSGQFARIEGEFRECSVALACLYREGMQPVLLYDDEARKLATYLLQFADWSDSINGK